MTQVMFDWEDGAVSVEKIQELYVAYGSPEAGKSVCSTPEDGAHSFLSRSVSQVSHHLLDLRASFELHIICMNQG